MKLKNIGIKSYNDFWYDLTDGGYIRPEDLLENNDDIEKVNNAIKVLKEFEYLLADETDEH